MPGPPGSWGLSTKGHLGVGADADITIYTPNENRQAMFELPRMVIQAGTIVIEQGEIRNAPPGKTLYVEPAYDCDLEPSLIQWFEQNYSIQLANYPVPGDSIQAKQVVGCQPE